MSRNTDPRPTSYAEWEDLEDDRDRLRSELDAIAKERSGPHCLRCRNAPVCSTRDDDRAIPLCVADPEGSMPLWDPVTLADVQAVASELDAARAELARVRRSQLKRMIDAIWPMLDRHLISAETEDEYYRKKYRRSDRAMRFARACRAELARMREP